MGFEGEAEGAGGRLLAGFAWDRVCGTQAALRAKSPAAFFPFFPL